MALSCQYCGNPCDLVFDHVTPKAQGGLTQWGNMVYACKRCNSKKGARTPDQAGMPLQGVPIRKPDSMSSRSKTPKKKSTSQKAAPQKAAKWQQTDYGITKSWVSKGGKHVTLIVADTELTTPKKGRKKRKREDLSDVPF